MTNYEIAIVQEEVISVVKYLYIHIEEPDSTKPEVTNNNAILSIIKIHYQYYGNLLIMFLPARSWAGSHSFGWASATFGPS